MKELELAGVLGAGRRSKGQQVKRVQEWLGLHGFGVVINGDFGPATDAAVRNSRPRRSSRLTASWARRRSTPWSPRCGRRWRLFRRRGARGHHARELLPGAPHLHDWVHVGIVVETHGDSFDTVEGNTNDDGSRNGYEVCARVRGYKSRDFILL